MPHGTSEVPPEVAAKRNNHTILRTPFYGHCDAGKGERMVPHKSALPGALKVHPRGFRVLSERSPVERGLGSYFRLPPPMTKRMVKEMARVKYMLRMKGNHAKRKKKVLDGFVLLKAAGVEDPEDAIEACLCDFSLASAIPEDLEFFTNLQYLDLGENQLQLHELSSLAKLEELHLHCSKIETVNVPPDAFTHLEALNLSFNSISDAKVFISLSKLPALSRLDLSGNMLSAFPVEAVGEGGFRNLHQLALERNKFTGESVFHTLSAIPTLQEVNLNHNTLSKIPSYDDPSTRFISLQVLSVAANAFAFFEDLFPLTKVSSLKRAVVWGNPLQRRKTDVDILVHELGKSGVMVYLEGPLPPKRRVGEFYVANSKNMVKVSEFKKAVKKKEEKTAEEEDPGEYQGSAFFMTEPKLNSETRSVSVEGHSAAVPVEQQDAPWFSIDDTPFAFEAELDLLNAPTPAPEDLNIGNPKDSTRSTVPGSEPLHSTKSAYTALKHALDHPLTAPIPTNLIRRGPKRKHKYAIAPLPPLS